MSRFHSYISTAAKLISSYDGKAPLSGHLKNYFRTEKKHGSTDRAYISSLCYHYFRTGHLLTDLPLDTALKKSWFLCSENDPGFLNDEPDMKEMIAKGKDDKLRYLGFSFEDIFPFNDLLSEQIENRAFSKSILLQPDLFIRVRPGRNDIVTEKLDKAGVSYQKEEGQALRLTSKTPVDRILYIDSEAVIQDLNSQLVLSELRVESRNLNRQVLSIWDCCAASGGKSILAADTFEQRLSLTVSDIRSSILSNLKERLDRAGIPIELSMIIDLEKITDPGIGDFDIIICDAPCTGSGTWSRTPEELFYFEVSELEHYTKRQSLIASNAIRALKPGGLFCYITCSVFKEENENIADQVGRIKGISLLSQNYLTGYHSKADTMFTALFRKDPD